MGLTVQVYGLGFTDHPCTKNKLHAIFNSHGASVGLRVGF